MLEKFFDFAGREAEIYKKWEEAGVFKVENSVNPGGPVFDITMPPPNANGELHIGHCYGHTIMDVLGRYHRLLGDRVLLVPGKDHAGIQTQVVYERKLREEGVEVEKMSREEFWKKCYDFCIDRSTYMRAQEKLVGTGADFDREIFTLDPEVSNTVHETFVKMWEDGLIYRGTRIVHWSVYSQTSISDVEVEYKEEKGHLWHIEYPLTIAEKKPVRRRVMLDELGKMEMAKNGGNHLVILLPSKVGEGLKIGEVIVQKNIKDDLEIERDFVIFQIRKLSALKEEDINKYSDEVRARISSGSADAYLVDIVPELDKETAIVVATTRPETMLGDTAVAVNPADPRYTHLIGKTVLIPISGREIKIIADDRIDIGFGTGAVKITPAHDFLDYQIGQDHKLEQIQVIDKFGKMTEAAGVNFVGLPILECRAKLAADLEGAGALLLTEQIMHKVPIAERGKDIVEPLISAQWFVAVDKEGLSLKKRALELINSGRIKVYPARLKAMIVQWLENLTDWNISRQILWGHRMPVWYRNKGQSNEEIKVSLDMPFGDNWEQETDTFDTWFSSGQWPYSTLAKLGFLDLENPTQSEFFPTHTMVMGRDILLFWACRMLLFSAYRFNEVPWKNIYFTGLVRDAKGQKMSKSKGNGIEPTELLSKYGADALRVGLLAGSTPGLDIKFDEKKVDSYAKFLNKIWNAAKLLEMKVQGDYKLKTASYDKLNLFSSKWILGQLVDTQTEYRKRLNNYELSSAFDLAYHFSWDIFCSWYLEIAKIQLETSSEFTEEIKATLTLVFDGILQMLHPFMPFFTEEIHENMARLGGEKLLAQKQFLKVEGYNVDTYAQAAISVQKLIDLISAAREVRKVLEKGFADKLTLDGGIVDVESLPVINKMANAQIGQSDQAILKPYPSGMIKIGASADEKKVFHDNIEKTLAKKTQELGVLERILTPGFKEKADPDLVMEREAQYAQVKLDVDTLSQELKHN